MKTKYKVIAIGSGPGSSVAASEIANKGIEVLCWKWAMILGKLHLPNIQLMRSLANIKMLDKLYPWVTQLLIMLRVCVLEAEAKLTVVYIIDALNLFLKNGSQKMDLKFQS